MIYHFIIELENKKLPCKIVHDISFHYWIGK